jgi:CHRD domain
MSTTYAENNLRRPMKKQLSYVSLTIGLLLAVGLFTVSAHDRDNKVRAKLTGRQEVPVVSTQASGDFEARIEDDKVTFKLSYELEGPVAPTQAHIHLGQRTANGGVMVFLCGGPRPACPASPATVEGKITAADIIALPTQELPAGAFDEFVRALRNGLTYANVHTPGSPGGEIRGQIRVDNGRHNGHDDDDDHGHHDH